MATPEQQKALLQSYKKCFGTDDGAVVLEDLSKFCLEHMTTFVPDNALATAFREGSRRVMIRIRTAVEADLSAEKPTQAISQETL